MEKAAGRGGTPRTTPCPPVVHANTGRSISANLTSVLSPTTTNEVLFTFSKLKLDIYHKDPSAVSLSGPGLPELQGPLLRARPRSPDHICYRPGPRQPVGPARRYPLRLQLLALVRRHLHQGAEHARHQGRPQRGARRKDQNFQNNEQLSCSTVDPGRHRQRLRRHPGRAPGLLLPGTSSRAPASSALEHRGLPPGLLEGEEEPDARGRRALREDDEQRRAERARRSVRARRLRPRAGAPTSTATQPPERRALASRGEITNVIRAPGPLMPRVNFAWDVKGDGDLIVRGGAGLFYNRPRGQRPVRRHQTAPERLQRGLYFGMCPEA